MRASRLVSLLLLLQTRGQLTAAAPAAGLGLGRGRADARLKRRGARPAELQERAERSARLFHLDTRGWFRGEDKTPHLPTLAAGVWQGRRIRARYREGPRVVQRTLDPLGLVLKAGAWYLVARRSAGMRVYRVSRFVSARVLEQEFQRPDAFELASFWDEWSTTFERNRPRFDVPLCAPRAAMQFLRPLVHPDGRSILDGIPREPAHERVELSVPFEQLETAYRELLTFAAQLEVLAPLELRDRIAAAAAEVVELYSVRTFR